MSAIVIKLTPPDFVEKLNRAPQVMLPAMAAELDKQNQLTIGHITAKRMSGQGPFPASEHRLGVRTGRLRQSLRATKTVLRGGNLESAIGSNVKYMGIHEFGGEIKPHLIKARFGKSLRFMIGGKVIFRRSVKHPGGKYPARAPIYTGINDRADAIGEALCQAGIKALGGEG
jgi:hypothetical protein